MSVRIKDLPSGTPSDDDYLGYDGTNGTKKIKYGDLPFYEKPASGVPKTDLDSAVQVSLEKADAAQPKTDSSLTTTAQTVVGAINEHEGDLSSLKEELAALGLSVVSGKLCVTYAES